VSFLKRQIWNDGSLTINVYLNILHIYIEKMPKKPCKPGQERHPETGRCRKKSSKKASAKKPSAPGKKPPAPGKKPPAPGKKPREEKLVSIRIMEDGTKHKSTSKEEKVCLLKKEHIRKIEKKLKIKIPATNDPCRALMGIFPGKILPSGWRITTYINEGDNGIVLGARGPGDERGALKIIRESDIKVINNEVALATEFHKAGLGPSATKIASVRVGGHYYHFLHMERIDGIVSDYLASGLSNEKMDILVYGIFMLIDRMVKYNLLHGDMHLNNIAFTHARGEEKRGKLMLIDFGWSIKGISVPQMEIAQVLRWLHYQKRDKTITESTFKYMDKRIREKAQEHFKYGESEKFPPFPDNIAGIMVLIGAMKETVRRIKRDPKLF